MLILANEDYEGVNPRYPAAVTAPKHAQTYVDALTAAGLSSTVWDVSAQGVPHDLAVLDHFEAVVWYLGDNRLTQDPEDEVTELFGDEYTDVAVAERQQALTMAVRDYLNGGGKLAYSGETAGYHGPLGAAFGGLLYGVDGAPDQDCVIPPDGSADCLVLSDDFAQYYLGAYSRVATAAPTLVVGSGIPFIGGEAVLGGPATVDNPLDEAGAFLPTSTVLPVAEFPSSPAGRPAATPARRLPVRSNHCWATGTPRRTTPTTPTTG